MRLAASYSASVVFYAARSFERSFVYIHSNIIAARFIAKVNLSCLPYMSRYALLEIVKLCAKSAYIAAASSMCIIYSLKRWKL